MLQKLCISLIVLFATITPSTWGEALDNDRLQNGLSAAELLERAVEEIAPAEKLDALESLWYHGSSLTIAPEEGAAPEAYTSILMAFPDEELKGLYLHAVHKLAADEVIMRTLAGERSQAGGIGSLPPEFHRDSVRYASTKLLTILRHRNGPGVSKRIVGRERADGRTIGHVEVTLFGFVSVLEIEEDSGTVQAIRFPSSPIQEAVTDEEVRRAYSDFRNVDGFKIPFVQDVTVGGKPFSRWVLDKVVINGAYDPALFELGD